MDNVVADLNTYINKVTNRVKYDRLTTERIINTQIALLFSDLAVCGKSDTFLGTISYKDGLITLDPSKFINGLAKGEVDPMVILKEIFENV